MQVSSVVFQSIKSFLQNNPQAMKAYVRAGLTVVDSAVTPLGSLMKHLLVVQGLDPNTVPGEKRRRELEAAIMASFNKVDDQDFDEDYDLSWVAKKFEHVSKKLDHLKLNKEQFDRFTNLNNLTNPFSASIASKYDSHTVTAPGTGPAMVEPEIGTPERSVEERLYDSPREEKFERYERVINEDFPLPSGEETLTELFDPRDPAAEKLAKLVQQVERKFGKNSVIKDTVQNVAQGGLQQLIKALSELGDEEDTSSNNEESRGDFNTPPTRTSKKTANKTSARGSFRRSPTKK